MNLVEKLNTLEEQRNSLDRDIEAVKNDILNDSLKSAFTTLQIDEHDSRRQILLKHCIYFAEGLIEYQSIITFYGKKGNSTEEFYTELWSEHLNEDQMISLAKINPGSKVNLNPIQDEFDFAFNGGKNGTETLYVIDKIDSKSEVLSDFYTCNTNKASKIIFNAYKKSFTDDELDKIYLNLGESIKLFTSFLNKESETLETIPDPTSKHIVGVLKERLEKQEIDYLNHKLHTELSDSKPSTKKIKV